MTPTGADALDDATRDRYLARLGVDLVPPPTVDTLRRLHRAHLERVPFENLDLHAGRRIELDVDRFVAKILDEHRGGFCYELNGAFAALLRSLGFDVELLEAHVHDDSGRVQPFDHVCLRVGDIDSYLVDVGFGDGFDEPIPFVTGRDHVDTSGTFRLDAVDGGSVGLVRDGEPQYRFLLAPRRLLDFTPGCDFHQSPESHFTKRAVCSRRTSDGRVTLRDLRLIRTGPAGRVEIDIPELQLHDTLRREFGVDLRPELLQRLTTSLSSRPAG
ncbi:MAG: arylamine N-acetyltransferase [Ilumatobacteraceae bacterium]|jgi:N-hydroxyarylamine O-acetyltransferase|nr:arylamine N-acetyltransferase [Ilumatobacteraceae bacterium]